MYARWQLWHLKGLSLLCCRLWDWGGAQRGGGRRKQAQGRKRVLILEKAFPLTPPSSQAPSSLGPHLLREVRLAPRVEGRASPSSPPHLLYRCPFFLRHTN